MKNFSIIHILLFILCMLVYKCASAQDFLLTNKGDTIRGETKLLAYGNEKNVTVSQEGKKKQTYSFFEIKYFRHDNEDYYPMKGPFGYNFMKLVKRGYLSLYAFQMENQTAFDGLLLAKLDGASLEVPNLSFKRQLTKFLEDCEVVTQQIENGTLSKKDLSRIIDEYNECIDKKSTLAEQKKPIKSGAWNALEEKLKGHPDFEGKSTALEMIAEIKNKLQHGEKVPNFMIEGLKSTLASQQNVTPELETALASVRE